MEDVTLATEEARSQVMAAMERLSLREAFLAGGVSPEAAQLELEVAEARRSLELHARALNLAQERIQRMEERVTAGVVSRGELDRARVHIMELQLEADLARKALEALTRGAGGEGGA